MPKKTPLYDCHVKANATTVNFFGWLMPLHYGSQLEEHRAVREKAGLFDVSHMRVVEIIGPEATPYLRFVLANDIAKLKHPGDALYSCMLNEHGGIIDDLIVYRFNDTYFRLVINAGCREKDIEWLKKQAASFDVTIKTRDKMCLLALQGPEAISYLKYPFTETVAQSAEKLKPFHSLMLENEDILIARTGYTGESGVEIMLSAKKAVEVWNQLIEHGVQPCGLGARDTLRLEAGLNLYGQDMTEDTSPLVSNLAWTVSFKDEKRDFVGKSAIELQKEKGVPNVLIGLIMKERGVLRNHQAVKLNDDSMGEITSGSYSPTLGHAIAMARIPNVNAKTAMVERRGEWLPVEIVKLPFIKK